MVARRQKDRLRPGFRPRRRPGIPDEAFSLSQGFRREVRRSAACGTCGRQYGGRLSWSPDSSSIAFSREGERWTQSLWAVDTASGKLSRLTDCQACADVGPTWVPSGQLIAFNRTDREGSSLDTVRADGSQLTKITDSDRAGNPQWSPDGRQIAFDDDNDIFIANADGSDQRRLLDGEPVNGPGVPSWSPDGSKLAYFYTPGTPETSRQRCGP